ncbi:MAG: CBS domain-containing protein [Bdellovibrionota bacterium]
MELKEIAILKQNLIVLDEEKTLKEAAEMMRENHIGFLIITKSGRVKDEPLGVVTDRDMVLRGIAEGRFSELTKISELMSSDPVSVHKSDSILTAVEKMKKHGVKRLLLIDDDESLYGVISSDDLFSALVGEKSASSQEALKILSQISKEQRSREKKESRAA